MTTGEKSWTATLLAVEDAAGGRVDAADAAVMATMAGPVALDISLEAAHDLLDKEHAEWLRERSRNGLLPRPRSCS